MSDEASTRQASLTDDDVNFYEAERRIDEVSIREILYGGPRAKNRGLVNVVDKLADTVEKMVEDHLQYREETRVRQETILARLGVLENRNIRIDAAAGARNDVFRVMYRGMAWFAPPGVLFIVLRLLYGLVQPSLYSHGVHLPPVPTPGHESPTQLP